MTEDTGCIDCGDMVERRDEDGTPWCHPCFHARGGEDDLGLISPFDDEDTILLRHAINEVPAMEPDAFLEMAYEDRFPSDPT